MVMCCLWMLLGVGIGVGGVAVGRYSKDKAALTPPVPATKPAPISPTEEASSTPALVSPMTALPPVVSPTQAPVLVGSPAPTPTPAPTLTAPFTTSPTAKETPATPAPTRVPTPTLDPLLQPSIDDSFDDRAAVLAHDWRRLKAWRCSKWVYFLHYSPSHQTFVIPPKGFTTKAKIPNAHTWW